MTMYTAVNSVVIRAVAVWIDGGNDVVSSVVDSKDSTKAVYRYYPENHIDLFRGYQSSLKTARKEIPTQTVPEIFTIGARYSLMRRK